ncbi:hypothetical protein GCM10007860_06300 [Chitiniphilus shinanonensis]|uniref:Uncharacterized protein n=1 Tax=Chitiniphilus shinanonensis TaxID=553088 RepID=A0ABQ6BNP2_9NEIS|nr:hypothetical protein [Chitiniphilus shinanonensis]GLS03486.1 hypothetical protein GCM10007860_06300 [Chitiniphilus shinanonensis]
MSATSNAAGKALWLDKAALKKATEHLLGICQGITADDHLNDQEVHFLSAWLAQYPEVTQAWSGKEIS